MSAGSRRPSTGRPPSSSGTERTPVPAFGHQVRRNGALVALTRGTGAFLQGLPADECRARLPGTGTACDDSFVAPEGKITTSYSYP